MTMNEMPVLDARSALSQDFAHDDDATLALAADFFHSLSDVSRLRILRHLLTGPHRVVDLTEHLGLAQSTVSKHLACLRDCGLVTSHPEGRATVWELIAPDDLLALLAATDQVLSHSGAQMAVCPTFRSVL